MMDIHYDISNFYYEESEEKYYWIRDLPEELLEETIISIITIKDIYYRFQAWNELVRRFSGQLFLSALEAIKEVEDDWERSEALIAISKYLPTKFLPIALEIATDIQDPITRVETLDAISICFSENEKESIYNNVLAVVQEILETEEGVEVSLKFSKHLSNTHRLQLYGQALQTINRIPDEWKKGEIISVALEHISQDAMPNFLAVISSIKNAQVRVELLRKIVVYLPESEKKHVLKEAFQVAQNVQDPIDRANLLIKLAENYSGEEKDFILAKAFNAANTSSTYLSKSRIDVFIEIIRQSIGISTDIALFILKEIGRSNPNWLWGRSKDLIKVAQYLPRALMPELLILIQEIPDFHLRALVLSSIAKNLPETEQHSAYKQSLVLLGKAKGMKNQWEFITAMRNVIDNIPSDMLIDAARLANSVHGEFRTDALLIIAKRLPKDKQPAIYQDALRSIETEKLEHLRVNALIEIAPHVDIDALSSILSLAQEIADNYQKALVLSSIARYFPKTEQQRICLQAIQLTRNISYERQKVELLSEIAKNLNSEKNSIYKEILSLVRTIDFVEVIYAGIPVMAGDWTTDAPPPEKKKLRVKKKIAITYEQRMELERNKKIRGKYVRRTPKTI